jgi:flagellar hook protein FlgE
MSFQQGLSGLNATSKSLDVIGHNVANANTYGAKVSRAEFADMYATAMNGAGSNQAGIGTMIGAVAQQFSQGNITSTSNALDLAINGAGFFQVADPTGQTLYSRNGQFKLNRDGYLVNNQNQQLMGYPANAQGVIQQGQAQALQMPSAGLIDPQQTGQVSMELNLDSRAAVRTANLSFTDASTYNNATSVTVYDSRGESVDMTYYFKKTAENTWDVYATANGETVSGTADTPTPLTTLEFTNGGGSPSAPPMPFSFNITANDKVKRDIGPIQLDMSKATEFGSSFGVTSLNQDGYTAGQLTGISIENDGIVMARYSNGESRPAGQLELVSFRNPQGLQPMGGNAWAQTAAAGTPFRNPPGQGGLGELQAGALEESNVDLTAELVNMMIAQRFYQANSQTIKTQDQVLQTLVNLR